MSPCLLYPMGGWIKMPLGTKVGVNPDDTVLDGDPAPPNGHSPSQFLAHVCCGQTAGWIKMPLGTEVGLGPGDIVLDGDPAPPSRKNGGTAAPHFLADVYCRQTGAQQPHLFGPCLL